MLYEVIAVVTRPNDKGEEKEYKEQYLVDNCETCGHAELKVLQHLNGKADCICIKQSKIREVATEMEDPDTEIYYKVIIKQDFIDDNGKVKVLKYPVLVAATSVPHATERANTYIRQGLNDMYLGDITETKIIKYLI